MSSDGTISILYIHVGSIVSFSGCLDGKKVIICFEIAICVSHGNGNFFVSRVAK